MIGDRAGMDMAGCATWQVEEDVEGAGKPVRALVVLIKKLCACREWCAISAGTGAGLEVGKIGAVVGDLVTDACCACGCDRVTWCRRRVRWVGEGGERRNSGNFGKRDQRGNHWEEVCVYVESKGQ